MSGYTNEIRRQLLMCDADPQCTLSEDQKTLILQDDPSLATNKDFVFMCPDATDSEPRQGITADETSISVSVGGGKTGFASAGSKTSDNPYFCGYPGARVPKTDNIGAAEWGKHEDNVARQYGSDAEKAKILFRWVRYQDGAATCAPPSSCTTGVCGTALKPGAPPSDRIKNGVCGYHLGYWSASALCAKSVDMFSHDLVKCGRDSQLYKCDRGIKSCYKDDSTSTCCGCVDWDSISVPVGSGTFATNGLPYTAKCVSKNPTWAANVLPSLTAMKLTCPSCYVYPFDDKASTFIATTDSSRTTTEINYTNYIIMACPGDVQSLSHASKVPGYRVVRFYNNCEKSVWVTMSGGAQSTVWSTPESKTSVCKTQSDCPAGTKCVTTGAIKQCFWQNYEPGKYELTKGGSADVKIPIQTDVNDIIWSGTFGFRSGCSSDVNTECEIGDCRPGATAPTSWACNPSVGMMPPASIAEFTMQKHAVDYYDVSIIDGFALHVGDGAEAVGKDQAGIKIMPSC